MVYGMIIVIPIWLYLKFMIIMYDEDILKIWMTDFYNGICNSIF